MECGRRAIEGRTMNKKYRIIGWILAIFCSLTMSISVSASEGKTDIEVIILPSETTESTIVSDENDGKGSEESSADDDRLTNSIENSNGSIENNKKTHLKSSQQDGAFPQTGNKNEKYYLYIGILLALISIGFIIKKIYGGKYNEKN